MFTFIHAADIHLDSPMRGLARQEDAPFGVLRGATREALRNLVALACEKEVDFVIIAGDLYDGDWPDHNTGLFFTKQMQRLHDAGIPVFLIAGNHDAQSQLTKHLRLPENVCRFSADAPETHELKTPRVALHGQSFATRAVTGNLAAAYPPPVAGAFNIGILHTALDGRRGHDPYAPCTLDDLTARGYDYWALGHVHTREVLCEDPPVVFPGNTQGRHVREPGAKGCYLVEVDERRRAALTFHPLDVFRWAEASVDLATAQDEAGLLERCRDALTGVAGTAEGRTTAVRITLTGATALHGPIHASYERIDAELRAQAFAAAGDALWVEKVALKTQPQTDAPKVTSGPLAELLADVAALTSNAEAVGAITETLEPLARRLPGELQREGDPLELADGASVRGWLEEALPLLEDRLRGEAG